MSDNIDLYTKSIRNKVKGFVQIKHVIKKLKNDKIKIQLVDNVCSCPEPYNPVGDIVNKQVAKDGILLSLENEKNIKLESILEDVNNLKKELENQLK